MQVGFIGLGTMGASMAANLQKAGYKLVVHDLNRQAASTHIANGAKRLHVYGYSGLLSFEFKPNDKLDVSFDLMAAELIDATDEYTIGTFFRGTGTATISSQFVGLTLTATGNDGSTATFNSLAKLAKSTLAAVTCRVACNPWCVTRTISLIASAS